MKKIYLSMIAILSTVAGFAQVSGIKTVPGDYASLSAAITALNTAGVGAGGATINVAAGLTETAPAGGYVLGSATLNASLSAANPLVIQKNPGTTGANPLLTAPVGTSTTVDGIFTLLGTDFVTINQIDLKESTGNTNTTQLMEWGFGLLKLSATDGCKNNLIQNCVITLQKTVINTEAGIYMNNHTKSSNTQLTINTVGGRNDNNKFYGNTIASCPFNPIYIWGFSDVVSPYTYYDQGNDIGGNAVATGNTMVGFGGLVGGSYFITNYGVYAANQNNLNVSFNTITQATDGLGCTGIYPFGTNATLTCNNNKITTSGQSAGAGPSSHYGIYSNALGTNLTASNNIINVSISGIFTGVALPVMGIYFPNGNNLTVTGNSITTTQRVNQAMYGVNSGATGIINISNNTINATSTGVTSGAYNAIIAAGAASGGETISDNKFGTISCSNTTGPLILINAGNATANKTISNNSVTGTVTKTGTGGNVYGYYNQGLPVGGSSIISGNSFSKITVNNATVYGINNSTTATHINNINHNTISNITGGNNFIYGINANSGNTGSSINDNTISNLSGSSIVVGIASGNSSIDGVSNSIYNNSVSNLKTTGGSTISGLYLAYGGLYNVYNNKIFTLEANNITGAIYGISVPGGTANATINIYNNFIGDLNTPITSYASDAIRGISVHSISANSTINLSYNSISIATTGIVVHTVGVYHAASATASTAKLRMINNIISNTSATPNSSIAAAFRRSGIALDNYDASSNNNLFYTGTPGAQHLIYFDGTNKDQTLADYQVRVAARDAASISVLPVFSSASDLHLKPTDNCAIDGKGTPIAITTDIDADPRHATKPDIGADEFVHNSALLNVVLPTTSVSGLVPVSCDEGGWTYYENPLDAGKYLFAIKWDVDPATVGIENASAKLAATVDLYVDPSFGSSTDPVLPLGTWTMKRFWNVNLNGAVMDGLADVRFFYDPADMATIDNEASTFASARSGSIEPAMWFKTQNTNFVPDAAHMNSDGVLHAIGLTDVSGGSTINGIKYAEFRGIASFSGGTYATGVGPNTPLPVTFNYLRGVKQGSNHLLNWKVTCNSTPKVTLTLERSSDQHIFTGIYSITADAIRCQQPFDHADVSPLAGMNYYRLKIADINGKVTYSNIISLLNAVKGFEVMNIAPNPVTTGSFKLNVTSATAGKIDVIITDMQGRIISKQNISIIAGYNAIDMNVSDLAAGIYNIHIGNAQEQPRMIRFVKQ